MLKLSVIYFTKSGEKIAKKLLALENASFFIYDKQTCELKNFVKQAFESVDGIIFISAAGIAVRLIAPYIKAKNIDPAVLVIDDMGQYVIPILSGHLGGANALASLISKEINATSIITTATDIHNEFAVDTWSKSQDCVIANISDIKYISAAILRHEEVLFYSEFNVTGRLPSGLVENSNAQIGIAVSLNEDKKPCPITLNVIPKIVTLGVGCKKNTDPALFEEFILKALKEQEISIKAVKCVASIELKRFEKCILEFCEKYSVSSQFYTAEELNGVCGEFTSSDFVKKTTGTDNVCERSAMYGGKRKKLLQKKYSENGMTIAISVLDWECSF